MSIFITGATGYIGSHLLKRLIEQNETVHILVRSLNNTPLYAHPNIKIFYGDLLNSDSIMQAMTGCDRVYHLAAFAKVWAKNPKIYFDINVQGTVNILNAAKDLNVSKVVVTSSAGVFGPSITHEISENSGREIDFFNEYESSKAISELKIMDFVNEGLNATIVSPTRVYGPFLFGKPESITQLICKYVKSNWRIIPGDGTKVGNYVYIDDVIDGHMLAMELGQRGHNYILGGENHDYNSFFKILAEESGVHRKMIKLPLYFQALFAHLQLLKIPFGGTPIITPKWIAKGIYNWEVNTEKASKQLGVQTTTLREGIHKTVKWINQSEE